MSLPFGCDISHLRSGHFLLGTTGTTGSDLIATVNYHSSFLRPWCQSIWTNTLPRHFCRGPASHKPFDFLSSIIYPFYMFLAAKTFSVHLRVRNHYNKRILNLILNRKKFLRRRSETLGRLIRGIQRFHGACPRQFVHPSIRQVRLRIGHKFVDGIGDIVCLVFVETSRISRSQIGKSTLAVTICIICIN